MCRRHAKISGEEESHPPQVRDKSLIHMIKEKSQNLISRPPIVVVMGHVDHGKTTLLDYIRKANVAAKEAGGITQSVGAYEIEHSGKKITFIDTPGHEAFSKMRGRGTELADLAILVVAVDDGVKPQTKEVIDLLLTTKTPFIVAINKIDKAGVDTNKVKNELMSAGVLLEGYGGNVSWHDISAKTGEGVNELLDLILLTAELENETYDPIAKAKGIVLEVRREPQRGNEVRVIIKDGTLTTGDMIATATAQGKVKILENFLGKKVNELVPSAPAVIFGFETLPKTGEEFIVGGQAKAPAPRVVAKRAPQTSLLQKEKGVVRLIMNADVSGSLEALVDLIKSMPIKEVKVEVVDENIGEITDGNVREASSMGAIIIGFHTKVSPAAKNLARGQSVRIITSDIIYELVKKIEEEIERITKPGPRGVLEVLAIFSQQGHKQLVGGRVTEGIMKNKSEIGIVREGAEIGTGKITSLKQAKQDVTEVTAGKECGLLIESNTPIAKGDKITLK